MAAGGSIDALSQFKLEPVLGLDFTQSNVMMIVASVLTFGPGSQRYSSSVSPSSRSRSRP